MTVQAFPPSVVARVAALCVLICGLAALCAPAASAHEYRHLGPNGEYKMVVGWRYEPAYVDVHNALDIYMTRSEDDSAIDANDGDTVDLQVELQLREAEAMDAKVLESTMLQEKPKLEPRTTNRYSAWVTPVRAGAYAVRIRGTVDDADDELGPIQIDETFVCGHGRQHGETGFNCIHERQIFPSAGGDDEP